MNKKIFWILFILGVLLRVFLAFSTFHPDVVVFHLGGEIVLKGNFFDLYDYMRNLPPSHPLTKIFPPDLFIYPPSAYLFFGYVSSAFSGLIPSSIREGVIYNLESVLGNVKFNFWLMFFKLSYLAFDVAISFFLFNFFERNKDRFLAFIFWWFNPVNLYVTYMMGQFDVIPTFFVVASFYLLRKGFSSRRLYLASLLLAMGASFKIYPMLFLVPLAFSSSNWRERFFSVFLALGVYVLAIVPFLHSVGFRSSALVAGHTLKSFYSVIPISGGESIILYFLAILFFYLYFYYYGVDRKSIWKNFFVILILFFIFTHYHPQWFLWITPFLVIDLVVSKLKHWPLVSLCLFSYFSLLFFFEPSLTVGLFSPILPFLYNSHSLWSMLGLDININLFRSIFHTIFVSAGVFYIFEYISNKDKVVSDCS